MNTQRNSFFPLDQTKLIYVRVVCGLIIVVSSIGLVPTILGTIRDSQLNPGLVATTVAIMLASLWVTLANHGGVRGQQIAVYGLFVTLAVASISAFSAFTLMGTLTIITVAVLGNRVANAILYLFFAVYIAIQSVIFLQENPGDLIGLGPAFILPLMTILLVGVATRFFILNSEKATQDYRRSADLLRTTTEVGQIVNSSLDLNQVLSRATSLIKERFGYYHAQVFLLDSDRANAILVASTGEAGEKLLGRKHRLAVGSNSVIGQVTAKNEAVIARDNDPTNIRYRNELLPATRAELALPILDGEQVIGALDVQSADVNAFSDVEIQSLQVAANLIATAIRNARLYEQQGFAARDKEALFQETQASLAEIQRLNRELTRQAWQNHLIDQPFQGGVTIKGEKLTHDEGWNATLMRAVQGEVINEVKHGSRLIAVPLMVRGTAIGALEIEVDAAQSTQEAAYVVQELADKLAITLENVRLYQEAQAATAQERRINEISARYQTVNTVDELLRITMQELGETLGANQGAVRLGKTSTMPEPINGGGA
jgi:GAF domain-containing protein